ncbi:cyclin-like protein [Artemisia annua]|uniref:Cyclin-like protein n=1 Tax=Artemisia annua TaxID=35608 RepID=A0A2U1MBR6_ARTAN|nr:cyclin-like protein [Artemisia annua]
MACLHNAIHSEEDNINLVDYVDEDHSFDEDDLSRMERLVGIAIDLNQLQVNPFDLIERLITIFCKEFPRENRLNLTRKILVAATRGKSYNIAVAATLIVMDPHVGLQALRNKLNSVWVNHPFDLEDVYTCYTRMRELNPVREYMGVIRKHEEHLQILLQPHIDQLYFQLNIGEWADRRMLAIQQMINMKPTLQFDLETAYMAVHYLDHNLAGDVPIFGEYEFRLTTVVCLLEAIKLKETINDQVELVNGIKTLGNYNYESYQVTSFERFVLEKMGYRLLRSSPYEYIRCLMLCICKRVPEEQRVHLAKQILFASTQDLIILGHRPSIIALAAVLYVMDQNLTRESMGLIVNRAGGNYAFNQVRSGIHMLPANDGAPTHPCFTPTATRYSYRAATTAGTGSTRRATGYPLDISYQEYQQNSLRVVIFMID